MSGILRWPCHAGKLRLTFSNLLPHIGGGSRFGKFGDHVHCGIERGSIDLLRTTNCVAFEEGLNAQDLLVFDVMIYVAEKEALPHSFTFLDSLPFGFSRKSKA